MLPIFNIRTTFNHVIVRLRSVRGQRPIPDRHDDERAPQARKESQVHVDDDDDNVEDDVVCTF